MSEPHSDNPNSDCVVLNLTVFALFSVLVFMALIYAILHCMVMVLRNSGYDFIFKVNLSVGPSLIGYSHDISEEEVCDNVDDDGEETVDHIKSEDEESSNYNLTQEFMSSMVDPNTKAVSAEEAKIKDAEKQERKKFEEACKRSCEILTPTLPSSSAEKGVEIAEDNTGGASKSYMFTGSSNLKFGDELPNVNHTSSLQPTTGKVNVAEMMKALGLREYKN
jgi:hypothetical protein